MTYHELGRERKGYIIPGFQEKLELAQSLADTNSDGDYQLDHVSWPKDLTDREGYPSEFFYRMVMSLVARPLCSVKQALYLINPPPMIDQDALSSITYLPIHRNVLMTLDGLYRQGGRREYTSEADGVDGLYSEHYGGIAVNDCHIEDIVVSALEGKRYPDDPMIIMPTQAQRYAKYPIIFHTHPDTDGPFGRMKEGIVYECPSGQDYYCFSRCRENGHTQIMIIIAAEGVYVMRPIDYRKPCGIIDDTVEPSIILGEYLGWIQDIQSAAMRHFQHRIEKRDVDTFHRQVGEDYRAVQALNAKSAPYNIWLEYYPRTRKKSHDEWGLSTIVVPYWKD